MCRVGSLVYATACAALSLWHSGWVLGPAGDRSLLDTELGPQFSALASIEQNLGQFGPDPSYPGIKREKWVVPWMEDDGHLGEPEFWVARTIAHGLEASAPPPVTELDHADFFILWGVVGRKAIITNHANFDACRPR